MQILAIFPFLTVDPSCPRQRFLRAAASRAFVIGHAAQLVGRLPVSLQRWIIQRYTQNLDPHALEATLGLFQRHTATNAFYLAQHEFKDLAAPADWWLLDHYGAAEAPTHGCLPQCILKAVFYCTSFLFLWHIELIAGSDTCCAGLSRPASGRAVCPIRYVVSQASTGGDAAKGAQDPGKPVCSDV